MHLLFLGIVKSCKELMTNWLRLNKNSVKYVSERSKVCYDLEKWGLSWLKLINTSSGWVSENYLAFSRIMKWYYSVYIQDRHTSTDKCESISANYGSEILRKLYSMIGYILNKYVNPRIIHETRRSIKLHWGRTFTIITVKVTINSVNLLP